MSESWPHDIRRIAVGDARVDQDLLPLGLHEQTEADHLQTTQTNFMWIHYRSSSEENDQIYVNTLS